MDLHKKMKAYNTIDKYKIKLVKYFKQYKLF